MLIVGIAGGTGSGKTTVVRKLMESLPEGLAIQLPLDSYYYDSSHVPSEDRQSINFDHPDAFDWPLLCEHLSMLKEGITIEQPVYDFLTCTRRSETVYVKPKKIILIEGILGLYHEELREQMNLKVFVDADSDERLLRVIKRDIIKRGRTVEAVMKRYVEVLKPMHLQFIEPTKRYADLIIPRGGKNQVAIDILTRYIEQHQS